MKEKEEEKGEQEKNRERERRGRGRDGHSKQPGVFHHLGAQVCDALQSFPL